MGGCLLGRRTVQHAAAAIAARGRLVFSGLMLADENSLARSALPWHHGERPFRIAAGANSLVLLAGNATWV
jgi:hypothetical protein